ncbi:hypothetical protein ALC56_05931 [Trachymyrmex septentrionalis]|uniref:Uncharacterized protein n=1 Tax=Trachymyrmex septentrionalis TaxID=34720 RepID=A0A195FGA9_9HYME|nr:hypothetical protein ALC56_05931 [Trachymyrmex septentrionalis]
MASSKIALGFQLISTMKSGHLGIILLGKSRSISTEIQRILVSLIVSLRYMQ